MYANDFTDYKHVLENYAVDTVLDETDTDLLDAIRDIDVGTGKTSWNLDPEETSWSLYGATVTYSGINDGSIKSNQSYKYVLGIRLRDDIVTPPGEMYLHYNDVFDPDKLVQ